MDRNNFTDFVHTGPDTLAGRFMRRFWQPVYVAKDLEPGCAIPIKIMSEDFTLYRGESGRAYAVDSRCAHRQTQLSVGWVEDDCIRCVYHGWKYDGSGQCIEIPGEEAPAAANIRIKRPHNLSAPAIPAGPFVVSREPAAGPIRYRARLGGMLNHYYRDAA